MPFKLDSLVLQIWILSTYAPQLPDNNDRLSDQKPEQTIDPN